MSDLRYVRVYPWGTGSLRTTLPHTSVCGVAIIDLEKHIPKIKVDGHWLNWEENECRFWHVTKAEFDTDLAFELWPQLNVKYCHDLWWKLRDKQYSIWKKWAHFYYRKM